MGSITSIDRNKVRFLPIAGEKPQMLVEEVIQPKETQEDVRERLIRILTPREKQVLDCIGRQPGTTRRSVAKALGMSESQASFLVRQLYRKQLVDESTAYPKHLKVSEFWLQTKTSHESVQ